MGRKRIYHDETWADGYGMIPCFRSRQQAEKAKQLVYLKFGVEVCVCQDDVPYAYEYLVLPNAGKKDEIVAYLRQIKNDFKIDDKWDNVPVEQDPQIY